MWGVICTREPVIISSMTCGYGITVKIACIRYRPLHSWLSIDCFSDAI